MIRCDDDAYRLYIVYRMTLEQDLLQEIAEIRGQLQSQLNTIPTLIDNNTVENGDQLINNINARLLQAYEINIANIHHFFTILTSVEEAYTHLQQRNTHLQHIISSRGEQQLEQIAISQQKTIQQLSNQVEIYRDEMGDLQSKLFQQYKAHEEELKCAIKMCQGRQEQRINSLKVEMGEKCCQLQGEIRAVREEIREKEAQMQQEIANLQTTIGVMGKKLEQGTRLKVGLESKYEESMHKCNKLQMILLEKTHTINKLMKEIDDLNATILNSYHEHQMKIFAIQPEVVGSDRESDRDREAFNLDEEVKNSGSGSGISRRRHSIYSSYDIGDSPGFNFIEEEKHFKKMAMDPYFAHFVLTSQAVKIREDCEDLLNIDIKPYYQQIVEKRIPMHIWDQWIRNRLRELLKKLRADDTQSDQQ